MWGVRCERQQHRSGRSQGDAGAQRHWAGRGVQAQGADDAGGGQGRLQHGEILADAGSWAAAERQVRVAVTLFVLLGGEAVGVETLRLFL